LHVHGGLVSASAGLAKAGRLDPLYRSGNVLPVFPIWESGLLEVIHNHADRIFNEHIFQVLLKFLLKHAGGMIGQPPGARGSYATLRDLDIRQAIAEAQLAKTDPNRPEPFSNRAPVTPPQELAPAEAQHFESDLDASREFHAANDAIMLGLNVQPPAAARAAHAGVAPAATLMSADIQDELRQDARPGARGLFSAVTLIKHGVKILYRIIERYAHHRAHGLWATTVEEIGRELYLDALGGKVWGAMKADTQRAFDAGATGEPRGGALFMQVLAAELTARQAAGQPLPKLSIVAHSAGSIWACHFLHHLQALRVSNALPANFALDRLILLAPACTCQLFAKMLAEHREAALFCDFRIFALSEPLESGYWEAPPLYSRSLLYMVSGMFEFEADAPLTGMQRYLNAKVYSQPEVQATRAFLSNPAAHAVWSVVSGASGLSSDSHRHGAFDDTGTPAPTTIASVLYLLTH
jgi:hypothetical protein